MASRGKRSEVLVGSFVFFGLLILAALVLKFGNFGDRIRDRYVLTVEVKDASGIRKGVPVRLGGAPVGFVSSSPRLKEDYSGLLLELSIFSDRRIPRKSVFSIGTSGLMGDNYVAIEMPAEPDGNFYGAGEVVMGNPKDTLEDLPDTADQLLAEVRVAVKDLGRLVDRVDSVFGLVEGKLEEGDGGDLKTIFSKIQASAENMESATKKLDPLLDDASNFFHTADNTLQTMDGTMENASEAMRLFSDAAKESGPTLDQFTEVLDQLQVTIRDFDRLIYKIERGDGLASSLVNDSQMRDDFEEFVRKLQRNGVLLYPLDLTPKRKNNSNEATGEKEKNESAKKPFSLFRKVP